MLNDEIVTEVRKSREAHAERFQFDLWAIYNDLKASEAKRIAAGHPYVESSVFPPKVSLDFPRFHSRLPGI